MQLRSGSFAVVASLSLVSATAFADALPSWRDGRVKSSIVDFVSTATNPHNEDFVPVDDRIAVFDNDGTLWSEKPFYFQVFFAMDAVAARVESDPSMLTSDALKAAARGDLQGVLAEGEHGIVEVVSASQFDLSVEDFQVQAREWLETARHPTTGRAFADMVYQPMLELLRYLRDSGFKTYIVSGGGVDFLRAFAKDVYGVPPYQVIGSIGNHSYTLVNGAPTVRKEPGIFFVDDKGGKPVGISRQIGVRPVFVAGNSDGDFEMLEWTTSGKGIRFGLIVHHTDAEREWAYDRDSAVGRLNRGLDEGSERGWLIVDMQRDWARIFP